MNGDEFTYERTKNTKFVGFLKFLMICSGTWPYQWTDNIILKKLYSFFYFIPTAAFALFCISLPLEIFINSTVSTENIYLNSGFAVDVTKIVIRVIIITKNKLFDIIKDIMSNEKILYKTNDWDAIECYLGYVRSLKFKLITLFITTMKTCITFILIEVYNNIETNKIHVAKNETIESPLLYPLYIPYYSMTEQNVISESGSIGSVGYKEKENTRDILIGDEVLYILNTFVALLVILGVNVTFGFSITFMTYAAARLGVLCIRLRRLKDIAITSYGDDINLALKILIMEHQHLIGFIRILNDKISMITFAEFLFSSINCALVIVNAIKADTLTISSMYSLGYMTLLIEQIFFYASSANEIKLQSIAIIDACYESDWNTFDEETKKMLLIVMMKACKPIEISIGPFSSMTNETALMMMKACYSYVAFIKDSTI
ncbi:hypothetical protein GWI33_012311 [Rhynchophorus ferrugineus]|uniref:Odorant receptor n=1 Tax=Rhynchophorus ferrugineus TaxID=354439 RepID=A0A834IS21_RHYFE|nr:hypothetical protein GWI33_012311 [Rhynchophorus ferrugineus]